ncbi:MAG TPA: hemerythrin domain-containing protein [Caulobacteraceae bacterium]|nr:hemerythrin domain-containing protein [Caulobacteraceae bacterium]
MLKADHRKVEGLFDKFQKGEGDKRQLARQICQELVVHTMIEEEIFYRACRRVDEEERPLDEAQVEHDSAKMLIADLMFGEGDDEYFDAKVKVLGEQIRHHIGEEEKPKDGIFALAEQNKIDTPELARRLKDRKTQLMAQPERLSPSRPVSFEAQPGVFSRRNQERSMPRNYDSNDRERDDRGRFMSDDDRGYRSQGSSRGGGQYRERDEEGRFTSDRGGESRSYMNRDDDYRSSSRGGGDRGHGGWFGDPQGHSQASREGWRHSSHEGSGWYGDPQGHSQASREGWRHSDHEGSGWYGDPQGHSQASREGWQHGHEGNYSSRGGRDYDERGGRGGGRGRDEEGRFTSGRGGGRDYDDDRGGSRGGHGGWFGDSQGHSEASRRGWEDRR